MLARSLKSRAWRVISEGNEGPRSQPLTVKNHHLHLVNCQPYFELCETRKSQGVSGSRGESGHTGGIQKGPRLGLVIMCIRETLLPASWGFGGGMKCLKTNFRCEQWLPRLLGQLCTLPSGAKVGLQAQLPPSVLPQVS